MLRNLITCFALLTIVTLSNVVSAQEDVSIDDSDVVETETQRHGPNNVITFEPIDVFYGVVELHYEHVLTDLISLSFGFGGSNPSTGDFDSVLSFMWEMGARFYLTDDAPRGFFVSPYLQMAFAGPENHDWAPEVDIDAGASDLSANLDMGYSWLLWDTIDLSIDWGIGYHEVEVSGDDAEGTDLGSVFADGLELNGRILLGVAF